MPLALTQEKPAAQSVPEQTRRASKKNRITMYAEKTLFTLIKEKDKHWLKKAASPLHHSGPDAHLHLSTKSALAKEVPVLTNSSAVLSLQLGTLGSAVSQATANGAALEARCCC